MRYCKSQTSSQWRYWEEQADDEIEIDQLTTRFQPIREDTEGADGGEKKFDRDEKEKYYRVS